MIGLITAASLLAAYDCQLSTPRAVSMAGANLASSEIGLPPMALRFSVSFAEGNPIKAKVKWDGNPIQVAGEFPAVSTAPGAYAFSAFSHGPCLFTEQACLTQVNLVDGGNKPSLVILTPVALATDKDAGTRSPFAVVAQGQCARTAVKK